MFLYIRNKTRHMSALHTRIKHSDSIVSSSDISNKLLEFPATKSLSPRSSSSVNSNDYYTTATFNIGISIYRGDKYIKKQRIHVETVPVFFSDKKYALVYTPNRDPYYLTKFIFKTQPNLFLLSYENLDLLKKDTRLTDEERAALNLYYTHDSSSQYIWPVGFLHVEDIKQKHTLYLNRRITNIICRLGFDGWVSKKGALKQKNLDMKYYQSVGMTQLAQDQQSDKIKEFIKDVMTNSDFSPQEKGKHIENIRSQLELEKDEFIKFIKINHVKYNMNPYKPEIVLCKWQNFLKRESKRLTNSI